MDDSKCLVCEFKNEGGNVAVGYQEWLDASFNTEDLDGIIEKEIAVKTKWPLCDVGPTNVMKKRLTTDCKWETSVIKIHAYGKWAEMCEVRKNLEKYGIAYLSRSDRRVLKKKSSSTDEDDEKIEIRKPLKAKGKKQSKNQSTPKKRQTKKELSNIQSSQQEDLIKRYFNQNARFSRGVTDRNPTDASSDENATCITTAKIELLSKIKSLTEENKNLREENTRLRALQSVTEYLPKIEKQSKKIFDYLQQVMTLAKKMTQNSSLNDNIPQTQFIEINLPTRDDDNLPRDDALNQQILAKDFQHITQKQRVPTVSLKEGKKSVALPTSPHKDFDYQPPITDLFDNSNGTLPKRILEAKNANIDRNVKPSELPMKPNRNGKVLLEDKNVDRNGILPSTDVFIKPQTEKSSSPTSACLKVDIGKKGIVYVSARNLAKCNFTSSKKLTGDLLSIIFSKEELATSSLTGTVANLHLNKNIQAKKQLDPQIVECIKCYIKEKFPEEKNIDEIVKKTVKEKCNNAVRRTRDIKHPTEH